MQSKQEARWVCAVLAAPLFFVVAWMSWHAGYVAGVGDGNEGARVGARLMCESELELCNDTTTECEQSRLDLMDSIGTCARSRVESFEALVRCQQDKVNP